MEQLPGGISIALEMLPAIILGDLKVDLKPIKDKKLKKSIFGAFEKILSDHSNKLGIEAHQILVGKLQHFNQATNKARLRAPFAQLNIGLSPQEEIALENRNDFLHGNIPDILDLGEDCSI